MNGQVTEMRIMIDAQMQFSDNAFSVGSIQIDRSFLALVQIGLDGSKWTGRTTAGIKALS